MSIVRSCLRIAAVNALRDRTWAGTKVFDSNNKPIDAAIVASEGPFISVFTDNDDRVIDGMDFFGGDQSLEMTIEIGIAQEVPAEPGQGSTFAIPATDEGFERALDCLERQVGIALLHSADADWGEVWKNIANVITRSKSQRAGEEERGVRWAARGLTFVLDAVSDPVPGVPLSEYEALNAFFDKAAASDRPGVVSVAAQLKAEITSPNATSWRQAQATLGLTRAGVKGIGLAPPESILETDVDVVELGTFDERSFRENDFAPIVGEDEIITEPQPPPDPENRV